MKNLKKLAKSELRKINGGNAPECPTGTHECYYTGKDGSQRWRCIPETMNCP
ncbi:MULTISPECIES: bacteriocin-like protein [Chryseobacterium]|uniref:bacteriocin-like protein n=1 Tax=Chryseobacterium TaxID=59732 RepID=UPI0013C4E3BF|nr:hypothetical protein [Chryseobacterium aurantiacum]